MGLVATLLPSQLRLSRLRAALRDRYSVITCGDWSDLLRACANEPVSMAVIDAGRFGLDGLIMADADDEPRRLLPLIEQAEARGVLETLRRALGDVKPTVRDATLIAVTRAHQRLSPEGMAKILGVRRKNLSERLAQAGFPTAQRLIAWGRLIVAARMLEDSERSADSVALALDFPSGSAFRNTCQRYLHAAPQQIRARGGASYVIGAFLRQIQSPARAQAANGRDTRHVPQLAV
jgi:AraC-like DNA-binding protein